MDSKARFDARARVSGRQKVSLLRRAAGVGSFLVLVGLAACSSGPGEISDACGPDPSVSCPDNGTGVSCAEGQAPDSSAKCAPGSAAGDFCCPSDQSCAANSSVSCPSGANGYSCNGGASPDDVYLFSSLFCDVPTGNGDYCCFSATPSKGVTCTPYHGAAACPTSSYGFSCAGSDTPAQDFGHLSCGAGVAPTNAAAGTALAGATLFCCTYD